MQILIDLTYQAKVAEMNLYFSGSLPICRLMTSSDNEQWVVSSEVPAYDGKANEVNVVTFDVGSKMAQFLRLEIQGRSKGQTLTLVEFDVWGEIN